jgi:hypothetical protein
MADPTDPTSPRFTDEEFSLILKRAAELQARRAHAPGAEYSLADMQEIAREAGIAPSVIAEAAAEVAAGHGAGGGQTVARGGAARFRYESRVEGELPEHARAELVDVMRAHTALAGELQEEMGALVWSATDNIGQTTVRVAPRAGGTKIIVAADRDETMVLAWGASTVVGFFVGAILAIVLREGGADRPLAIAVGLATMVAVAWGGGRVLWRRRAAWWAEHVRQLGEALTRAARELSRPAPPGETRGSPPDAREEPHA